MYRKIINSKKFTLSRRLIRLFKYIYASKLGVLAFKDRYKLSDRRGFVVKNKLSKDFIKSYKKKWSVFGKKVEIQSLQRSLQISGKVDINIVPEDIFSSDIEPTLNSTSGLRLLEHKSIYNKWFDNNYFPKAYLHKINNVYYDDNLIAIKNIGDFLKDLKLPEKVVVKISTDSSGGRGVFFVDSYTIYELLKKHENIVVQEFIKQHEHVSSLYEHGISSIRVCVYRSVQNGDINILNTSLRMGKDGSLDNETAGGIVNSLNKNGELNDYAVDKYGIKYFEHPNSKIVFRGFKLPFFSNLKKVSCEIMNQIPFANLASLDLCLDSEGRWRVIEVNLSYQTIRFAQYAGQSFFSEFTDEVIKYSLKNHWILNPNK